MVTIGIDIGGTNISLGLVEDGRLLKSVHVPSFPEDTSLEQSMEYLCSIIGGIMTDRVEKIGIGVPSVVDVDRGIVYDALNIPSWKEVPICDILSRRFGVPVSVNNDANCFAWGVYKSIPVEERPQSFVTVTLGTGIGLGIVANGKLYCGAHCGAGEICCLPYKDSILEDYCSKKFFSSRGWDPKEAQEEAESGNAEALLLYDELGKHLGAMMNSILYLYDPAQVVLAGGIANSFPFFKDSMFRYLNENFSYRNYFEDLVVRTCTDDDMPVIGASMI